MKIFLLLTLLFLTYLSADVKQTMINLYKEKKYKSVCHKGFQKFHKFSKDEKLISLYAFSCLEAGYIDRLSIPIVQLKYSSQARKNAAFLSLILMQKKLLYHALVDGVDIASSNFPTTQNTLSKVFDFYLKLGKHEKKDSYVFEDKNDKRNTYKLYLKKTAKLPKMVIEEFYDTIIKKRYIYH